MHKHKSRFKALDFSTYHFDANATLSERAAHALDWAATHFPKQLVAVNVLLKAIMGYSRMPQLRSEEVEGLRKKMQRVKTVLRDRFGRGFITERGVGCRATVDSEDQLKTGVVAAANRFASASRGLQQAGSLVDVDEIPKTAENKPWLDWWEGKRGSIGLKAQIAAVPNYIALLQAPATGSNGKEEKKD